MVKPLLRFLRFCTPQKVSRNNPGSTLNFSRLPHMHQKLWQVGGNPLETRPNKAKRSVDATDKFDYRQFLDLMLHKLSS